MVHADGGFSMKVQSALLVFALAGVAFAGMTFEHMLAQKPPAERIATATTWEVLDVTVGQVSTHTATNGDPPRVELVIREVLRGPQRLDPNLSAVWAPMPHDIDWSGPETQALIARWRERPLEGPAKDARFVVMGEQREGEPFRVSAVGRFPWTEAFLAEARAAVARGR